MNSLNRKLKKAQYINAMPMEYEPLIGKVDERLNLLFVYGNRIYFSQLPMGDENNKQTIFYSSDIHLSKVEKIAQFRGEVYLVGDSIILKKNGFSG